METTVKQPLKQTAKQKDPKFRVIPNLSLKGKDIATRLKNRTLKIDTDGQYSLEAEIDETRRMSKLDISRKAVENNKKINSLNDKLKEKFKKNDIK